MIPDKAGCQCQILLIKAKTAPYFYRIGAYVVARHPGVRRASHPVEWAATVEPAVAAMVCFNGVNKQPTTRHFLAGTVFLLTVLVYIRCLNNDFVWWDDDDYVFDNPFIKSLDPSFFKWAFFGFHAGNWHPLTWISHALDYAIWGLNPLGHHLTSIILHACNAFMVVGLTTGILDAERAAPEDGAAQSMTERLKLLTALVTGLLFGLHPLHVESVAWIAERKDLLCGLFFLSSLTMYVKFVGTADPRLRLSSGLSNKWYILSLACFILALLSKPMAVSLPLVLLILDWYPFRRITAFRTIRPAVIEKLPFLALSLFSSVMTILAQHAASAIAPLDYAPLPARLLVAAKSIIWYLWKIALPLDLLPLYPYPANTALYSPEYIIAVVMLTVVTLACLALAGRRKLWLAAWAYYVVTLVPVLGMVQVGSQAMADRYTYIPGLGPFLVIGLLAARGIEKTAAAGRRALPGYIASVAVAVLVIASLSYLTFKQAGVWKDSISFWSYVIEKVPEKASIAFENRGVAYKMLGQPDKALEDYDRAIAANPINYGAYNNKGVVFLEQGAYDAALAAFDRSIAIFPGFPGAYYNRGCIFYFFGQNDKALKDFDEAIRLNANYAEAYLIRGKTYQHAGNEMLALANFRKACDLALVEGCNVLRELMRR